MGKRHRSEGNGEKVIGTKIKRKETSSSVPNKDKDKDRLKRKKPSEYYIQQSIMEITDREKKGEDKEKKRKRKRRYDLTTSNSEASLKKVDEPRLKILEFFLELKIAVNRATYYIILHIVCHAISMYFLSIYLFIYVFFLLHLCCFYYCIACMLVCYLSKLKKWEVSRMDDENCINLLAHSPRL